MLKYDVLLHLDKVLDYSPLPHNLVSQQSDISSLPASIGEKWLKSYLYKWSLGVVDGTLPRPSRPSVQDRLQWPENMRRDRSPPGDGRPGKRGRGGNGAPLTKYLGGPGLGESSKSWHSWQRQEQGGVSDRKRAYSCPPTFTTAILGTAAQGQKGAHYNERKHSRWKMLEDAFMEQLQLPSEPLGAMQSIAWDPMVHEAGFSQVSNESNAGRLEAMVLGQVSKEVQHKNVLGHGAAAEVDTTQDWSQVDSRAMACLPTGPEAEDGMQATGESHVGQANNEANREEANFQVEHNGAEEEAE